MAKSTVNKSDIIEEIAIQHGIPKSRAEVIVNEIFQEIIQSLHSGQRAEFRGLRGMTTDSQARERQSSCSQDYLE